MKILYFTKYTRKGASSRLRSYQYFPYLEENGMEITVSPLFNDEYLENIYTGKRSKGLVVKAYWSRLWKLFAAKKYEKVVVEYELFPYLPGVVEWLLKKFGVSYIVDYDDAIFHNYDLNKNKWIRKLLGGKIDCVMRNSKTVVVGNDYLAERAKRAGAEDVQIIPTVVDLTRYQLKAAEKISSETIIGWIGTKSTFKYVQELKGVFQTLAQTYAIKVHVVGIDNDMDIPEIVKPIKWSEETEAEEICKFDIGIMPLSDSPWEKGKCSYKLIQYMACGLPVIASPVGMNAQVVQEDKNGFFASSEKEWISTIEKYIISAALRRANGLVGRSIVEKEYALQSKKSDWLEIIKG